MNAIEFRRVSDDLVEVLYDGVISIVSKEEAMQLGYREFTYQGKEMTVPDFAELVGKNYRAVTSMIQRHNYRTGEEIINHYTELENNKSLTYQGKHITIVDFAKLIGKHPSTLCKIVRNHEYCTGEEIIEYYNKLKNSRFTYRGKSITVPDFARLIGKNEGAVASTVHRFKYHTGEEVISYYNNKDAKFTYQGRPISIAVFAKLIGKNYSAVLSTVRRYKCNTGEEVIKNYNEVIKTLSKKELTYQGRPITVADLAELLGKTCKAVSRIIRIYKYRTGEEVINHYKELTYKGKPITVLDFAKLIGKRYCTVWAITKKYNYHTGEEIIEHYKMKGIL